MLYNNIIICSLTESDDELLDECISCGEHLLFTVILVSHQDVHLAMNNGINIQKEEIMKLRC